MKRAFISFDAEHDEELRDALVRQAKDSGSPFSISDWSVHVPFDEKWREQVRNLIRRSDIAIIICGEHTHRASGVAGEVAIVRELNKPYFLLKGRRHKICSRPNTAPRKKRMHAWTWDNLKELIANPR